MAEVQSNFKTNLIQLKPSSWIRCTIIYLADKQRHPAIAEAKRLEYKNDVHENVL